MVRFLPPMAPRSKAAGPGILSVLLLVLAAIGLATAPACAKPAKALPVKKPTIDTFKIGATKVTVELFAPERQGKYPAIILLHDSAGLKGPGPLFRMCAKILAGEGYVVLLVHYFDGTPHQKVEKEDVHKKVFQSWLGNVAGAVRHARTLKNVDPQRIGLCGFSLGGYLAGITWEKKASDCACAGEKHEYLAMRLMPFFIPPWGICPVSETESLKLAEITSEFPRYRRSSGLESEKPGLAASCPPAGPTYPKE
jgi:hypothetical protein